MKPTVLLLVASSVLVARGAEAQTRFEGTVRGTMEAAGTKVEMAQHVKGSKLRLDLTTPDGMEVSQILDLESGKTLMLVHQEKMWIDWSIMGGFMSGGGEPPPPATEIDLPKIEPHPESENETIAGHACRHYTLLVEGGDDVEVCATTGLGCFIPGAPAGLRGDRSEAMPTLSQNAEDWLEVFEDGFFILSMEAGDATYRVDEVESEVPPDDIFVPPADYREMKGPPM